jgi:hypothetical protein
VQRIIIRHLTGTRANQVDEFGPPAVGELAVGRDPGANVRFDPDRDDVVSRQHMKIVRDPVDPSSFHLVDLQSSNGTFLNRQRVYGAVRIGHGDTVQVGAAGPEFRFELDPPPAVRPGLGSDPHSATSGSGGMRPTRRSWLPAGAPPMPAGRVTMERIVGGVFERVRRESNKAALFAGMALAAILAVGAVTWQHLSQSRAERAAADEHNLASLQRVNEELKKNPVMAGSMKEQIARLENELRKSDRRHESTVQALLKEIKERTEAEARLRAPAQPAPPPELAANQASQAVPLPGPAPSGPDAGTPAPPRQEAAPQDRSAQSFDALMDAATEKFQRGNPAEALALVRAAIAKEPKRWEGYEFAGQIAVLLEDYSMGASMFEKALESAPAEYRPDIQYKLDDLKKKAAAK